MLSKIKSLAKKAWIWITVAIVLVIFGVFSAAIVRSPPQANNKW
jgi:hypothetical protein